MQLQLGANLTFVSAGQTCGVLGRPAANSTLALQLRGSMDFVGAPVSVAGTAIVAGSKIDSIALQATVDLARFGNGLRTASIASSFSDGELCFAGQVVLDGPLALPLGVSLEDGLQLGACLNGSRISEAHLRMQLGIESQSGEAVKVLAMAEMKPARPFAGTVCLAGTPVEADGMACCAGHAGCGAASWRPFSKIPGLPAGWSSLSVTALSGSVSVASKQVGVDVQAALDLSSIPPLAPGLALVSTSAFILATVGPGGKAEIGLRGLVTLPLGEQQVPVSVSGSFAVGGGSGFSLSLKGQVGDPGAGVSADLQPLEALVGDNVLVVRHLSVEVKVADGAVTVEFAGGAGMSLPPPLSIGPLTMAIDGFLRLGRGTGLYLAGSLCGLTIPASLLPPDFGNLTLGDVSVGCSTPVVKVALATRAFPDRFVLDDVTVKRGLTIVANIELPKAVTDALTGAVPNFNPVDAFFGGQMPKAMIQMGVDIKEVLIRGAVKFPLVLVRPQYNIPTVKLLQLNDFAFVVSLRAGQKPALGFDGSVLFQPGHCLPDWSRMSLENLNPFANFSAEDLCMPNTPAPFRDLPQQRPLKGFATLLYLPPSSFKVSLSLLGVWYEPFWTAGVALANPAVTLGITVVMAGPIPVPLPDSIGINGDGYWKRPYYDRLETDIAFPMACRSDSDCTGTGPCAGGGKCPAACVDGSDPDLVPDQCIYTWPAPCGAGVAAGTPCIEARVVPAEVPASIGGFGVTLFYNVYPSPSELLFGLPLPMVVVRGSVANLNSVDLTVMVNERIEGVRHMLLFLETMTPQLRLLSPFPPCVDRDSDGNLERSLTCAMPPLPLPNVLEAIPVGFSLDKLMLYFSTHTDELFGGLSVTAGLRAELDLQLYSLAARPCNVPGGSVCPDGQTCINRICTSRVLMAGVLDDGGLRLEGRISPINVLDDALVIKADPFARYLDVSGTRRMEMPTAAGGDPIATLELWLVLPEASGGPTSQWDALVSGAGFGVEMQPGLRCRAAYDDCSSGACAVLACEDECASVEDKPGNCSVCAPPGGEGCEPASCSSDDECIALAGGDASARCLGRKAGSDDADTLAELGRTDAGGVGAVLARTASQTCNTQQCAADELTRTLGLTTACSLCLARHVTCEPAAHVRVHSNGQSSRTVQTSMAAVPLGRWAHLALVLERASGLVALYVDGERVANQIDSSPPPACGSVCACNATCGANSTGLSCLQCASREMPADSHGESVALVRQACAACQQRLAAYLGQAGNQLRFPASGTVLLGSGTWVQGLDDVRGWTVERTATEITTQRTGVLRDSTPGKLGDCSNAGPGVCGPRSLMGIVSMRSCTSHFDCRSESSKLCEGFVPKGTCRQNSDCQAGATCQGAVPGAPRGAFDQRLRYHYEFDYDGSAASAGRLHNSQYAPSSAVDCRTQISRPLAGPCSLIGAPCADYDRTGKLDAAQNTAVSGIRTRADDSGLGLDDLLFKLFLPFGADILTSSGLWLSAGASLQFFSPVIPLPSLLSNGGARVEVALASSGQAHGELFVRPFELLGLGVCAPSSIRCGANRECSDPTGLLQHGLYMCREDGFCTAGPCLGVLTVSGYGPDGIDNGVDDGFYARVNLLAKPLPTFAAGARLALATKQQARADLAFLSVDFQCPPGQVCSAAEDYRFAAAAGVQLDLRISWPGFEAISALQICGNAAMTKPGRGDAVPGWLSESLSICSSAMFRALEAQPSAAKFGTLVNGHVSVLGQTVRGSVLLNSCGLKVFGAWEMGKIQVLGQTMPPLGSLTAELFLRFSPFRLCASGSMALDMNLVNAARLSGSGTASFCLGPSASGTDSGVFVRASAPSYLAVFQLPAGGAEFFRMSGSMNMCFGTGDAQGQAGVKACSSGQRFEVCGPLSLLGGIVTTNGCVGLALAGSDLSFSLDASATVAVPGLPAVAGRVQVRVCPAGQMVSVSAGSLVCVASGNGNKIVFPTIRVTFVGAVSVGGITFGSASVAVQGSFNNAGQLSLQGSASFRVSTPPAGLPQFLPSSCTASVTITNGVVTTGTIQCPPYCLTNANCAAGTVCCLGICRQCCVEAQCTIRQGCYSNVCRPGRAGELCTHGDRCRSGICFPFICW